MNSKRENLLKMKLETLKIRYVTLQKKNKKIYLTFMKTLTTKQQIAKETLRLYYEGLFVPRKNITFRNENGLILCCPVGAMYYALTNNSTFSIIDICNDIFLTMEEAIGIAIKFDGSHLKDNIIFEQIITEIANS